MNWIFVGTLLGSLVTSTHDTRESCEGRAVVLKEKGVVGQCVERPTNYITFNSIPNNGTFTTITPSR